VADRIAFHGWVDERHKHEILARAWVHLCPSVKEGWGIVVMEAGAHGVPTVAYHAAGGVGESVLDRRTGLLADDLDEFVAATELLLTCERLRTAMGAESREHVSRYEWKHSVESFDEAVRAVLPRLHTEAETAPRPATVQR
jgi:glycosyltransferase involved in cell wall biosynthesis